MSKIGEVLALDMEKNMILQIQDILFPQVPNNMKKNQNLIKVKEVKVLVWHEIIYWKMDILSMEFKNIPELEIISSIDL